MTQVQVPPRPPKKKEYLRILFLFVYVTEKDWLLVACYFSRAFRYSCGVQPQIDLKTLLKFLVLPKPQASLT